MQIQEAITLIQTTELKSEPATWADLGCGTGLFSLALAHLLPPHSKIYAVDKEQQQLQNGAAKQTALQFYQADFVKEKLPFSQLDGVLIANALHYVKDKPAFLENLRPCLATDASFIIIEYDTLQANQWVPYPINFIHLKQLFSSAGYTRFKKLGERPSLYRSGNMYACQFFSP